MALAWTLASTILMKVNKHRPAYFLPIVTPGVVLISTALSLFEGVWVYRDNQLVTHANTALVAAFALPYCAQIAYLAVFVKSLNRQVAIREYFTHNRKYSLPILVLSFLVNYRMIKLSYCNLSPKFDLQVLRVDQSRPGWTPRRLNMLFSIVMMVFDVVLCFNAISATFIDAKNDLVTKVCIERIAVSLLLAVCTLSEFIIPTDSDFDLDQGEKEKTRHLGMVLPVQMEPEDEHRLPQSNYKKLTNISTTSMITATEVADTTTQPFYRDDWA